MRQLASQGFDSGKQHEAATKQSGSRAYSLRAKRETLWRFAPCFVKDEALSEQSALAHLQASLQMRLRLII